MAEVENLCDRIAILSGGRIAFSGTVEQLGKTVGKHYNITIQTETGTGKYESDNIGETLLTLLVQCREKGDTLIQSMTVFGVTMGALIGLPPSLVEIYGSDIKKVYLANGVPLYLGIALANISAFIHLFIMSIILYIAAPLAFDAKIPENPGVYFVSLSIFIAVSLGIASIIGLAVKDQTKTSMFSIIVFLPSIMLSGIMFPVEMLPQMLETIGKAFPASWGYRLMTGGTFGLENLLPMLVIFVLAVCACAILLSGKMIWRNK